MEVGGAVGVASVSAGAEDGMTTGLWVAAVALKYGE